MLLPIQAMVRRASRLVHELSSVHRIVELSVFLTYLLLIVREAPRIVRSRTLVPADGGLRNCTITYRVRGQRIVLNGSLFPGAREIYGREVYFAWPGVDLACDDTVVDLDLHLVSAQPQHPLQHVGTYLLADLLVGAQVDVEQV